MSGMKAAAIFDALASHAKSLKLFSQVVTYEPKAAPSGPTYALFVGDIAPYPGRSGLATVSMVLTVTGRIHLDWAQKPEDRIDRDMIVAMDKLISEYVGDLDLGDADLELDCLGQNSEGLRARPGYIEIDRKMFRVIDISLPVIINDVWTEAR